ncbi:hypothetical protein [Synechococcus sp. PCC 6312]|uniref:hypothetical protein n=1 Tax=Synechococcus sp. (strain ATCC 27167 / PCC 6312) TaxID=195253 RepID=UPI00029ED959|nr:hypothetical protein [Synechococcus sp. PCC 6312]AFY60364.1 hypothetical protein Syn6312_1179 [Synechococcus sp. PCC 6312]
MADLKTRLIFSAEGTGRTVGEIRQLQNELKRTGQEGAQSIQQLDTVNTRLVGSVQELAAKYYLVISALQGIVAAARPAYDLLIGQNERLQQQILGTAASVSATNRVFQDGFQIADPTEAITAVTPLIEQSLAKIRKGSLELVGVTSGQLVDSYQIIAGQTGELDINLDQAADLTLDFAAALGTLGIPLFQARQEITSIAQGTIDQNSILAKTLGLTNDQVKTLKEQGRLYDVLREKLAAFRAGNALAANSIDGITSNIQELVELLGLELGAPLREQILGPLADIFEFLNSKSEQITEFLREVINLFDDIGASIRDSLGNSFSQLEAALAPIQERLVALWADGTIQNGLRDLGAAIGQIIELFFEWQALLTQLIGPQIQTLLTLLPFVLKGAAALLSGISLTLQAIVRGIAILVDAVLSFPRLIADIGRSITSTFGLGKESVDRFFRALVNGISDPRIRLLLKLLGVSIAELGDNFDPIVEKARDATDAIVRETERLQSELASGAAGASGKIGEQIKKIDAQIESLRRSTVEGRANREEVQRQITVLEELRRALAGAATGTEVLVSFQKEQERTLKEIERLTKKFSTTLELEEQERQNRITEIANAGLESSNEIERQKLESKRQRIEQELAFERENLAKIEALQGDPDERESAIRDAKLKTAKLAGQLLENEAQQQKQGIAEIEQVTKESLQRLQLAEQERQNQIQELLNQGLIRQDQAERKRLQSTRERTEAEFKAEQEKLDKLEAAEGNNAEAIAAQKQKLAEITGRLLENEFQQQQKLRDLIIKKITEAEQLQARSADLQAKRLERLITLAGQQERVFQSQVSLQQALDRLTKSRFDLATATAETELEALKKAGASQDQIERKEKQIQDLKLQAIQASQLAAQRELEFQIQAEIRANKRLEIEAKIAALKAKSEVVSQQAALEKLKLNPEATPEQIKQAQELLDLTRQQAAEAENLVTLAQQEGTQIQQTAQIRREALQNDQTRERLPFQRPGLQGSPLGALGASPVSAGVAPLPRSPVTPAIAPLQPLVGVEGVPPLPSVSQVRPVIAIPQTEVVNQLKSLEEIVKTISGQVGAVSTRPNVNVTNNNPPPQLPRGNQLGVLAL